MSNLGGTANIVVNGVSLRVAEDDINYSIGNKTRESKMGADGSRDYTEVPVAPFIEFSIKNTSDIKLSDIIDVYGATVHMRMSNGNSYVWQGADQMLQGEGSSQGGSIALRYEADSADEI